MFFSFFISSLLKYDVPFWFELRLRFLLKGFIWQTIHKLSEYFPLSQFNWGYKTSYLDIDFAFREGYIPQIVSAVPILSKIYNLLEANFGSEFILFSEIKVILNILFFLDLVLI